MFKIDTILLGADILTVEVFSLGLDDEVAGEDEEEEEEDDIECQSSNNSLLNLNEVTHHRNFFSALVCVK